MASQRYTVVFSVAVCVAAVATYAVYRTLQQAREANQVATQTVVVAGEDVQEGERLDRANVKVETWPSNTVPAGAFGTQDSVIGRVTRVAVFKGEAIVPGRLAPEGVAPGLEVKITPGKRAMAVKINDVVGLAGLIEPNSRVDVLVTLKEDGSMDKQRAKLFMENVRVLSVGTQVERGDDGKPINATTAALEVTPAESERLAVAMNQGSIQLVLRGYGDPDSVKTGGANESDVLAQLRNAPLAAPASATKTEPTHKKTVVHEVVRYVPTPAPAPAAPPPPPPPPHEDSVTIQVYRGSKLDQQTFHSKSKHDSTSTAGTQ